MARGRSQYKRFETKEADRHRFRKIDFACPALMLSTDLHISTISGKGFLPAQRALRRRFSKATAAAIACKPNKILHIETKKCDFVRQQEDFTVASGQEKIDRSEVLQRWCQEVDHGLTHRGTTSARSAAVYLLRRAFPAAEHQSTDTGLQLGVYITTLVCGQNLLRVRRA